MVRFSGSQRVVLILATLICCGSANEGRPQFTPFNDRSRSILEGNWQSCRESDGEYAERIYDGNLRGMGPFELHMGPYHQFAFFRGIHDEHRDHGSPENFLQPCIVPVTNSLGHHAWRVLGLRLEVTLAGGSRDECESWWVSLRRADLTSSH